MALRAATGSTAHRLRRLNAPKQLRVKADRAGRPLAILRGQRPVAVEQLRESWRIDDEWWRDLISRRYHLVALADGAHLTLFQDLVTGEWWLHE